MLFISEGKMSQTKPPRPQIGGKLGNLTVPIYAKKLMKLFISEGESELGETTAPPIRRQIRNTTFPICATFPSQGKERQTKPPRTEISPSLGDMAFPICALSLSLRTEGGKEMECQTNQPEIWPLQYALKN